MADTPVPHIPALEAAPANDAASLSDLVRSQASQIAQLLAALEAQGKMLARAFEVRAEVAPVAPKVALTDGASLWRAYVSVLGARTWAGNMQSMMRPLLAHWWPSLITYRPRYRASAARIPVAGPDIPVELLAAHHWTDFRATMNKRSVTYRNMVLARLRAFFTWAVDDGRLGANPLAKAKPENKRPRRETTITDAQCAAIMAAQPHPYFQTIMALASHTGMRRDEVRTLRWDQIDLASGRVRLSWTTTKSRKSRDLYIDPTDILMLYELKAWTVENRTGGACDYLFPRPRKNEPISRSRIGQWFREACEAAGVQAAPGDVRVHFHDATRHTFATDFLRRGGDIRILQKILGHASLNTTHLYVHSSQEEVRKGFEEMHRAMRKPPHHSD